MTTEQALAQVIDKYRSEGYRVIPHPGAADLPTFAAEYHVDLVAFNGNEKVLVQVKESRKALQDDSEAIRMAEAVSQQPGWRFDLVVLNRDGPEEKIPPDASEPPAEKIAQHLASAEQLASSGEVQLSCIVSWAALEAAMRHAARASGIEVKSAAPSFLLRALYSEGLLHRDEFERLNDAIKLRNALVHGMMIPGIDPKIPQYIVSVARRLLSPNGKKQAG